MLDVQTLLAEHLTATLSQHKFPLHQLKAITKFSKCRTAALGGNAQYCKMVTSMTFGTTRADTALVLSAKVARQNNGFVMSSTSCWTGLIIHIIFTTSSECNVLFQYNRNIRINILFKASHEKLRDFANDPQHLNSTPGMISSLHTWGRNLSLHPHL